MSQEAINFAFKQEGLHPSAKLLLLEIANMHNATTGLCTAYYKTLEPKLGLAYDRTHQTVRRHMKELLQIEGFSRTLCINGGAPNYTFDIKKIEMRAPEEKIVKSDELADMQFNDFWQEYPRKDAKETAKKAWKKSKFSDKMAMMIIQDVMARSGADWKDREKKFIPLAATYLNGKRWKDEITVSNSTGEPSYL